jgi:hypothetical protein
MFVFKTRTPDQELFLDRFYFQQIPNKFVRAAYYLQIVTKERADGRQVAYLTPFDICMYQKKR